MGTWRFDWRYTAAGLGWGVAVGALTGVTLAVLTVIGALEQDSGGFSGAMFLVLAASSARSMASRRVPWSGWLPGSPRP